VLVGVALADGHGVVRAGAAGVVAGEAGGVGADAGVDDDALVVQRELEGEAVGVDVAGLVREADAAGVPQQGPGAEARRNRPAWGASAGPSVRGRPRRAARPLAG
jgi:hypothetical protein